MGFFYKEKVKEEENRKRGVQCKAVPHISLLEKLLYCLSLIPLAPFPSDEYSSGVPPLRPCVVPDAAFQHSLFLWWTPTNRECVQNHSFHYCYYGMLYLPS